MYYRLLLPGLDDSTSLACRGIIDQKSIEPQAPVGLAETDNSDFSLISSVTGDIAYTAAITVSYTHLTLEELWGGCLADRQTNAAQYKPNYFLLWAQKGENKDG